MGSRVQINEVVKSGMRRERRGCRGRRCIGFVNEARKMAPTQDGAKISFYFEDSLDAALHFSEVILGTLQLQESLAWRLKTKTNRPQKRHPVTAAIT